MTNKLSVFFTAAWLTVMLALAGCGGGGGGAQGSGGASKAGPAASVILSSSANSVKADGSDTVTITATVVDVNHLPVENARVNFASPSGQLGASSGFSNSAGVVTIGYKALAAENVTSATITASVVNTSISAQIPIRVTAVGGVTPVAVYLSSSAASIKADGSNSTTITATVVDANYVPVAGANVSFSKVAPASGQLVVNSRVTGSSGTVTVSYSASPGTPNFIDHNDTIKATVDGTSPSIFNTIDIKVTASSYSLLLGTSVPTVKSDGSNSAIITATVMDSSNLAVSGQTVKFTAQTGQFGTSSGPSSATGVVTIPFFGGLPLVSTADRTNRNETVTANILGTSVTAQIPIQVIGSTLTLDSSQTITQVGVPASLTATARDASAVGVNAQSIKFSISSGSGTLNGAAGPVTVSTGANGTTSPSVTLVGTAAGNLVVNADWLNAAGTSTFTTSKTIAVTSPGISFAVTSPTTNPTLLKFTDPPQPISVSVPTTISGITVANIRFATTLGTWLNSSKVSTKAPTANTVSESLTAGSSSGNANIQIDALDSSGTVLATLSRVFALSSVTGTQISLQPSVSTVAPSTGGSINTSTLTATVRDAANNTVGSAPVLFEIVNPTGSGEQISPVIAYTNSNGQAIATFTSGASSTVGGLQIKATVVGTAVTDTKTINVAGNSVSVTIGQGTVISSTNGDTTYTLPMSVLVVSSTGGAVSGSTVTLSAFPTHYLRGNRDNSLGDCKPVYVPAVLTITQTNGVTVTAGQTYAFPNEDVNEDDILEADSSSPITSSNHQSGEDYDPIGDLRGAGSITPPHAAAGTLPPTVVTDANGVGTFNLIYLKNYANWIYSRIRAKVVVNGTEFVNELRFMLPPSVEDVKLCNLPNSPFGQRFGQ
ncbi:MAG: Ig-like domain-containing protein [Sterolibacterium sp.]|nr:Ig-like domain-containing protein [Sterolibacterium sp.]